MFEIFIGSFFLWHLLFLKCYEGSWVALVFCVTEASNSPRPATQWTDNLPRDATMIYFLCSIMSKFRTKTFGFMISFNSPLNWEEEEEEIGTQTGSLPCSLLIPRAYECYCCASRCKDATIKCHKIFTRRLFSIISTTILYIWFLLTLKQNTL